MAPVDCGGFGPYGPGRQRKGEREQAGEEPSELHQPT